MRVYFFTFLDNKFIISLENLFLTYYNKISYFMLKNHSRY